MEFYQELLLTAVISMVVAFLIGKLAASLGSHADDLDRDSRGAAAVLADPAIERPDVGGTAEGFLGGGISLVEEESEDADEVGKVSAHGRPGSDRIQGNEIISDDHGPDEEDAVSRSEEAKACESDPEEGNVEALRFEVDAGLEAESLRITADMLEIERIGSSEFGSGGGGDGGGGIEVKTLVGPQEENLMKVNRCRDEIPREQESCIGEEVEGIVSDRIQTNEIISGDLGPGKEEAKARESDLEERNFEALRSEADTGLDTESFQGMTEIIEIERIDSEFVETVDVSPEDKLMEENRCRDEIPRGQESCIGEEVGRIGSMLHGEDEWEGIEKSELENLFSVAADYSGSSIGAKAVARLSGDVQLQLYGLHKVATEGTCYEQQPLALMVSARAKWHAWQKLGNMNPEVAMEQYISLLSHSIPGWMGLELRGDAKQDKGNDPLEEGILGVWAPDPSSLDSQLGSKIQREQDDASIAGDNLSDVPKQSGQGLAKAFFLNVVSPTTVRFLLSF